MSRALGRRATVLLAAPRGEERQDLVELALVTAAFSVTLVTLAVTAGLPDAFQAWAN